MSTWANLKAKEEKTNFLSDKLNEEMVGPYLKLGIYFFDSLPDR